MVLKPDNNTQILIFANYSIEGYTGGSGEFEKNTTFGENLKFIQKYISFDELLKQLEFFTLGESSALFQFAGFNIKYLYSNSRVSLNNDNEIYHHRVRGLPYIPFFGFYFDISNPSIQDRKLFLENEIYYDTLRDAIYGLFLSNLVNKSNRDSQRNFDRVDKIYFTFPILPLTIREVDLYPQSLVVDYLYHSNISDETCQVIIMYDQFMNRIAEDIKPGQRNVLSIGENISHLNLEFFKIDKGKLNEHLCRIHLGLSEKDITDFEFEKVDYNLVKEICKQ